MFLRVNIEGYYDLILTLPKEEEAVLREEDARIKGRQQAAELRIAPWHDAYVVDKADADRGTKPGSVKVYEVGPGTHTLPISTGVTAQWQLIGEDDVNLVYRLNTGPEHSIQIATFAELEEMRNPKKKTPTTHHTFVHGCRHCAWQQYLDFCQELTADDVDVVIVTSVMYDAANGMTVKADVTKGER